MKIVFVSRIKSSVIFSELNYKSCSGTVYSYLIIAKELADKGHEVIIISPTKSCVDNGIQFLKIDERDEQEKWLAKQKKCDAIIGVSYAADIFANSSITAKQKIFWWHNTYTSNFKELTKLLFENNIDYFVGISKFQIALNGGFLLKQCFKNKKNILHRVLQIYNPIMPIKQQLMEATEKKEVSFAFIGNPDYYQGFHKVLKVFDTYKNQGGKGVLKVFGGNDLHGGNDIINKQYEKEFLTHLLYKDNKKRDDVIFYGSINRVDLYNEIVKCDALIAGLQGIESFSISTGEVSALGIPVITRKRGGQNEIITHNKTGYSYKYSNQIIVKGLWKVANLKENKIEEIKIAAIKNINRFHPNLIIVNWEKLLQKNDKISKFKIIFQTIKTLRIIIWGRIRLMKD